MPTLTKRQATEYASWARKNPVGWVQKILGEDPWGRQRDILNAVRDNKTTAVKSANGVGKTWLIARLALWFGATHSPSIVITTAPTDRQVRAITWKEIKTAYAKARKPLGGRLLSQELRWRDDWWILGFTASDNDPTRFQGFHELNAMVIVEEACGVSRQIYEAVDSILTSANCRRVEIGNPTNPATEFGDSFKTPGVKKISITAYDSPNLAAFGITEEDIAARTWREKVTGPLPYPKLVTPEWVAERYARWGPNNPLYRARVLAEFPDLGVDNLIPLSLIEAAQRRELEPTKPSVLGVDVARYGDDQCAIYHRQGPVVRLIERFGKVDTMTTAGHVIKAADRAGATQANIDVVGLGAGVVDRLREVRQKTPERVPKIVEASAGSNALDTEEFINARAEWYDGLRERFETGDIDIDPADDDLAGELAEIKWKPDSRGRTTIEEKDKMKARLGRSPDSADAVSIAFMPVRRYATTHRRVQKSKKRGML